MNVTDTVRNEGFTLGEVNQGETFGIKSDAAFFDILSNSLYSDPELAVVRETITNALDANKEANSKEPIEVTVDLLRKLFIVKDYGNGIPHEKIHEIYCTYGSSTKRDTTLTGGFGLGCKSPFALVNSFSISNCYNGLRKTYILAKEDGIPKIIKVEGETEDDCTGLTITIPLPSASDRFYHIVRSFLYYSGAHAKLNGTPYNSVTYKGAGYYYVKTNLDASTAYLGIYGSTDFIVKYGYNLYPVKLYEIQNKDSPLKTLYGNLNFFQSVLKDSYLNFLWGYYSADIDKIIEVPANSVDITPNRENLRFTDKTLDTLCNSIQKEINNFIHGINPKIWLDTYKENRLAAFGRYDSILESIYQNRCFTTSKDTNSLCFSSSGKRNLDCIFNAIITDTTGTFNQAEKDLAEYWYLNQAEISKLSYKTSSESPLLQEGLEKWINFEKVFTDILLENGISRYWYGYRKYNVESYTLENFRDRASIIGNKQDNALNPLYKVVILTNYSSYGKGTPLEYFLDKKLPYFSISKLVEGAYRVLVKSPTKAAKIQDDLETNGWYVINVVQEPTKTEKTSVKTQEIIANLQNKDTSYYVTNSARSQLLLKQRYSYSSLYNCFVNSEFIYGSLDNLKRYSSYEVIEMSNVRQVAVLKKNGIKSMEEVVLADIKQMLYSDKNLCLIFSLIDASRHCLENLSFQKNLTHIVWFLCQMPELCERYKLPELDEAQLKNLCLINSCLDTYPEFYEKIKPILITDGRVIKFLNNIHSIMSFNANFVAVINWIHSVMLQLQDKGYDANTRVYNLLVSTLDSLFLVGENDE